ncbi:hypothetical protein ACLMNJ_06510, partial [Streptomyces seoulensis]
ARPLVDNACAGDTAPTTSRQPLRQHEFKLSNGVPIHEVSRWLGHRSVKTTVDIYGHLLLSAGDRCREVLQRAMRPAPLDATSLPAEEASWSADARAA